MLHKRFLAGVLLAAVLSCVSAAFAAQDETGVQYSDAQIALFRTPHLDNVTRPTTLEYEYRHDAAEDENFVDTVKMTVKEISPDGGKTISFEYLTGSHARSFQDLTDFRGNPLIMIFLEDDVRRMKEELGGGGVYMRNRIRHAFYDRGQTRPITFELDGRTVSGTQVIIAPFVGDKNRERLGDYEHKTYEFVVSPEVPGGIYRIRSTVPASSAAEKPLTQDSLIFRGSGS